MIIAYLAGIFLLSILLATVIIPRILFISYKKRLFDVPDSRKVHKTPIPRLGGLSFLPVILIALCSVAGAGRGEFRSAGDIRADELPGA